MKITLTWPLEVGLLEVPSAEEMCHAMKDAWADCPPMKAESASDRHELSFEVPYFGGALHNIRAAKRIFTRSFGINPDIKVDGAPLEVFAWRENAGKIYRQTVIDEVKRRIGRGKASDDKEAGVRVYLRESLNLTDAEIVATVDAEARLETRTWPI